MNMLVQASPKMYSSQLRFNFVVIDKDTGHGTYINRYYNYVGKENRIIKELV